MAGAGLQPIYVSGSVLGIVLYLIYAVLFVAAIAGGGYIASRLMKVSGYGDPTLGGLIGCFGFGWVLWRLEGPWAISLALLLMTFLVTGWLAE